MTQESTQRPALTTEEIARLRSHEQPLSVARQVLDDLDEIGADTAAHRDLLDNTERMRRGLLDKFSTTQYVNPPKPRARR